eukprot:1324068-Amphidinium_carterae.1
MHASDSLRQEAVAEEDGRDDSCVASNDVVRGHPSEAISHFCKKKVLFVLATARPTDQQLLASFKTTVQTMLAALCKRSAGKAC